MKRLVPARLHLPPSYISMGDQLLVEGRREFAMGVDRWMMIYYLHRNAVSVDAQTMLVEPNSAVIFPPGSVGRHGRVGEDTYHFYVTFNLPATEGQRYAIPVHVPDMAPFSKGLRRASDSIGMDLRPGFAFVWNFLFSIAESETKLREHQEIFAAEEFILERLSQPISVDHVAEAAGLSSRQLLRMFRREHGMTVQEFVRTKRVQEATRLLVGSRYSIKEIAMRVGVPNLQQFNKLIREATGSSPRSYRDIHDRDPA